ncbi:MAG: response regulator [Anaerolineales bacterium]|nr:response regulator [Anaerolineales bacterium]
MVNERILVVDDEKGVVRSCTRILEREGFDVSGRTESSQVPDLLRQETFDLLLTDIKMPKIDGLKLLKIAKEIDPHLTVVLITGYGTMEDAIEAISLGAQGFLMKPFEPEDLIGTIKENLRRRALLRDSLRLQTLLPLLEINQMLQVSGGEISLARRVLDISTKAIGAQRMSWLRCMPASYQNGSRPVKHLSEAAVVSQGVEVSQLPPQAIERVLQSARPVWITATGSLLEQYAGQPNIIGAVLPLMVKGEVAGIMTAETGGDNRSGPFGQISLDLLSVLAGQLTMIIENVQLFQQTETLRAFNESIIQNLTNGLIAVDAQNRVTVFNPAAAAMLGYSADKILHQPLPASMDQADRLMNIFKATQQSGSAQPRQEITIQHQDERHLPISISTAPLLADDQQATTGVVAVIEDLSEIKALEAERRRLDRLAALGEMSAVVAHEIRNPIAGIAAGVDYLTRNLPAESAEAEGAALIQGEISRVNRILEDILFVARPLQLNFSAASLPAIIDKVIQRYQRQAAAKAIEIRCDCDHHLPVIEVDSQRLEQVFNNLILNAIQAMSGGGPMSIEGGLDPSGRHISITISDSGPGIPADIQTRIFEPFFTTKTKGTGLGLSIARQIIEAHNGAITIETRSGHGTQFIINLPITKVDRDA